MSEWKERLIKYIETQSWLRCTENYFMEGRMYLLYVGIMKKLELMAMLQSVKMNGIETFVENPCESKGLVRSVRIKKIKR